MEIVVIMWIEFFDIFLMVDIDIIENVKVVDKLGFDIIGIMMYGYILVMIGVNIVDNDFVYLKEVF